MLILFLKCYTEKIRTPAYCFKDFFNESLKIKIEWYIYKY